MLNLNHNTTDILINRYSRDNKTEQYLKEIRLEFLKKGLIENEVYKNDCISKKG